ncbi:MAG TPA: amidohydrolase family protein [Myxococcota bacterium]|jgi:predicted TIM-barrel fold metal-dependent hydrolase|nr:amidohydrolase family protein [Myxococcota bacterium]
MTRLPYGLFDGDNHYYEPRDAFTRHLEPRYRDKAVRVEQAADGTETIWIGKRRFTFLADMELNFETTVRPGSLREFLRTLTHEHPADADAVQIPVDPAFVNRDARLALMDRQGIESVFLFPTLGVCVEHFMKDDVEQTYANLRAFNRWLDEDWGFAHRNRIFASPVISLLDEREAVKDLEWALARGARIVNIRVGPVPRPDGPRSPADPIYDAFWARANEAGATIAYHVGESGYNEMMSVHWGEQPNPSSHSQSAFQWTNFYGDRPIMDTLSALILHNLFGRFPNVKVVSVENGSLFVPYLMKVMDKMKGMGRNGPWLGGRVHGRPSEILKQHVWVNPYHEEDHVALAELIGVDHVVFGSDFPHPECVPHPDEWLADMQGKFSADDLKKVMRDNARHLVGLPA